ncbi:hypothetical protein GCM10010289_79620 [Streptomyces violascens]|nr:hypothetical protein GCM10010289_79620 [Streptomyces violascens]
MSLSRRLFWWETHTPSRTFVVLAVHGDPLAPEALVEEGGPAPHSGHCDDLAGAGSIGAGVGCLLGLEEGELDA